MDGITIRAWLGEEIELLEQMNEGWPFGRPLELHRQRLDLQQAGQGVYLFAWHGQRPVGHVFLRWESTSRFQPGSQPGGRAHVSDLFVIPDYWSRGVGTRLMDALERLAAEHGCGQVGLSVAVDNVRARSMYAARGYEEAGSGVQPARWTYIDEHGEERVREEMLIYLIKQMPAT